MLRSASNGILIGALIGATSVMSVATVACVGGKQQITAEDKDRLKAQILDAVPPDAKKVDINFENKVHVVGYKVDARARARRHQGDGHLRTGAATTPSRRAGSSSRTSSTRATRSPRTSTRTARSAS